MRYLITALKRTRRNTLFAAMLALLFVCVLFFGGMERSITPPKTGVTVRDADAMALSLQRSLEQDGMTVYPDEETMCLAIRNGDITAGIAVKEGLTARLEAGQIEHCTVMYAMPTSSFVQPAVLRTAAHLCDLYAPYLVERLSAEYGVTLSDEQVRAYIDDKLANDAAFEFCFSDMYGAVLPVRSYAQGLVYGFFAVLLFCLFALCAATEKDASFQAVAARLGAVRAFDTVWLPALAVRYLLCVAAVGAAGLLCRALYGMQVQGLWWQCAVYMLFLCGIGALLDAVLRRFARIQLAVMVISLLALGICPVFVDINAFIGIPEAVRCLLPPYFFYKVMQAPAVCTAVAAAVCAAGLWLRRRMAEKSPLV